MEITSTEAQNNFGLYIKLARYEDIIVTKNGKKAVIIKSCQDVPAGNSKVAESTAAYSWESSKISYEEFVKLSEESDNRYEYIDGEVYQLSSPTYTHQSIVVELLRVMLQWFNGKKCKPLTSPFDVTLLKNDDKNVVQPDILVICDTENVNEKGKYMGVPSLVVEILSESTRSKDMVKKLDLYINSGVREYWIVNPFNKEIYLYHIEENDIRDYRVYKGKDIMESSAFEGLKVSLEEAFEG